MASFGDRLRQERKARQIRLSEISRSTKISREYLTALESNEFDRLPGGVFNKGFVRAYAETIGVDPEAMVHEYESEAQAQELRRQEALPGGGGAAVASAPENRSSVGIRGPVVAVAILLLVAGVAVTTWLLRPAANRGTSTPAPGSSDIFASQPAAETAERESSPEPSITEPARTMAEEPGPVPASGDRAGDLAPAPERNPELSTSPGPKPTRLGEPERIQEAGSGPAVIAHAPGRDEPAQPSPAAAPGIREKQVEGSTAVAGTAEHRPSPAEQASTPPATGVPAPKTPVEEPPDPGIGEPSLSIPEAGVGTRVVNRRLEGRAATFEVGEQVWFWTKVLGGSAGESIYHVWLQEGNMISSIKLDVGGPHWRTHTWQTMRPDSAGHWTVEARDAQGRVLARESFTCTTRTPESG